MSEKLRFKDAIEEWIWFLGAANKQREPVVPQFGRADSLNGADGDGTLRRNDKLIVNNILCHNVDMSIGLQHQYKAYNDGKKLTKTRIRGVGLLDRPNLDTRTSPRQEKRTLSDPVNC